MLDGILGTSRTFEDPPDYASLEHVASTAIEINAPPLYHELIGIAHGVGIDRRRDVFLPSTSLVQQGSILATNTSSEKGESVMLVETQSPRQLPARRAQDAGIRIAGGPLGRQMQNWGGPRRGSEVASSTGSTLPPAYDCNFD